VQKSVARCQSGRAAGGFSMSDDSQPNLETDNCF
jgi:hypothetical protein